MSKSYRFSDFAPWIIVAVGLSLFTVFAFVAASKSQQAKYDDYRSASYSERAQSDIQSTCIGMDPPAEAECVYEIIQATNEQKRAERDLAAQEDMAVYALLMAVIALAALVATVIGILYIRETLVATQSAVREAAKGTAAAMVGAQAAHAANKIAARQFEAGFKPWLLVKISGPYLEQRDVQGLSDPAVKMVMVLATIEVTNFSDMPATIRRCEVGLHGIRGWGGAEVFEVLTRGDTFYPNPPTHDQRRLPDIPGAPSLNGHNYARLGVIMLNGMEMQERKALRHNVPPIIGEIIYLDPLGKRRKLGFAFRPSAAWGGNYSRWGGEEYNYDREES